jgi:hypothetical protein
MAQTSARTETTGKEEKGRWMKRFRDAVGEKVLDKGELMVRDECRLGI